MLQDEKKIIDLIKEQEAYKWKNRDLINKYAIQSGDFKPKSDEDFILNAKYNIEEEFKELNKNYDLNIDIKKELENLDLESLSKKIKEFNLIKNENLNELEVKEKQYLDNFKQYIKSFSKDKLERNVKYTNHSIKTRKEDLAKLETNPATLMQRYLGSLKEDNKGLRWLIQNEPEKFNENYSVKSLAEAKKIVKENDEKIKAFKENEEEFRLWVKSELERKLKLDMQELEALQEALETINKEMGQQPFKVDLNTAPINEIKKEFLPRLKPLFNQELISQTGEKAYFNLKSLSKMMSDKAIKKSLENGFSREQHLRAVSEIKKLFEKASLVKTDKDLKGSRSILIHRFNSEFENSNALITTKESLDKNKNKIYSVELELTPRFSDEAPRLDKANINQG